MHTLRQMRKHLPPTGNKLKNDAIGAYEKFNRQPGSRFVSEINCSRLKNDLHLLS
jgi:hypothetical protein